MDALPVGWAGMARQQRRWSIVAATLLTSLLGGLLWYGLRTDWRPLYAGLDPDDARQVGLTLTQAQIPYDVSDNGTTLRVAAAQLDKARLATAAKGEPRAVAWDLNSSTNRTGLARSLTSR